MDRLKIVWLKTALNSLQSMCEFHKINSETSAKSIIREIFNAPDSIVFPYQYQIDPIYSNYKRVLVRDYKIPYELE